MRPGLTEGVAVKAYIFKDNKLLVIYKTEAEAQGNLNTEDRRDIPGGRVEFGEQPEIALRREVYEEVGLQIDVLQPFMVWSFVKNELQLVGINYLCLWHSGEVVLSVEHEKYEWLTYEDILRRNWGEEQYHKAFEHFVEYKRNKEYKEALLRISRNEESLQDTLTDSQRKLFAQYLDSVREFQDMAECLLFQNSFRLGARMMLEIMNE